MCKLRAHPENSMAEHWLISGATTGWKGGLGGWKPTYYGTAVTYLLNFQYATYAYPHGLNFGKN
jgi:hypothetical protein